MGFLANFTFTSLFGRRFGLTKLTSAQSGYGGERDYLTGQFMEDIRRTVTAETTGTTAAPDGISRFSGTSAGSSAVYTLAPPIPGVVKYLSFDSTSQGPIYVKTANGETIISTQGTTFSIIKSTNNTVGMVQLMGLTTAVWQLLNTGMSTATFALTTTT